MAGPSGRSGGFSARTPMQRPPDAPAGASGGLRADEWAPHSHSPARGSSGGPTQLLISPALESRLPTGEALCTEPTLLECPLGRRSGTVRTCMGPECAGLFDSEGALEKTGVYFVRLRPTAGGGEAILARWLTRMSRDHRAVLKYGRGYSSASGRSAATSFSATSEGWVGFSPWSRRPVAVAVNFDSV